MARSKFQEAINEARRTFVRAEVMFEQLRSGGDVSLNDIMLDLKSAVLLLSIARDLALLRDAAKSTGPATLTFYWRPAAVRFLLTNTLGELEEILPRMKQDILSDRSVELEALRDELRECDLLLEEIDHYRDIVEMERQGACL